jgi:hypothetical protein
LFFGEFTKGEIPSAESHSSGHDFMSFLDNTASRKCGHRAITAVLPELK